MNCYESHETPLYGEDILQSVYELERLYKKIQSIKEKKYKAEFRLVRHLTSKIENGINLHISSENVEAYYDSVYSDRYSISTEAILNWGQDNPKEKLYLWQFDDVGNKYKCRICDLPDKLQKFINDIEFQEDKYNSCIEEFDAVISSILSDGIYVSELYERNKRVTIVLSRHIGKGCCYYDEIEDVIISYEDERVEITIVALIHLLTKIKHKIGIEDFDNLKDDYKTNNANRKQLARQITDITDITEVRSVPIQTIENIRTGNAPYLMDDLFKYAEEAGFSIFVSNSKLNHIVKSIQDCETIICSTSYLYSDFKITGKISIDSILRLFGGVDNIKILKAGIDIEQLCEDHGMTDLLYGDRIVCADDVDVIMDLCGAVSKFSNLKGEYIYCTDGVAWTYCIKLDRFLLNDPQKIKSNILQVKKGRLVRFVDHK